VTVASSLFPPDPHLIVASANCASRCAHRFASPRKPLKAPVRQISENNEGRHLRFGCGLGPSTEGFERFIPPPNHAGRRSATAVGRERGGDASIAKARGGIIGASDCDREHLIPDPKPRPCRAFRMPHAAVLANWRGRRPRQLEA
jgi:hypothetical protein